MGSFSMTCSISGLGIDAGTPVRALLLTENPYGEGWDLRTPPIRARYNDCGSIERVHPRDLPVAKLWLRGLREDLVELGAGDNQCHDVPNVFVTDGACMASNAWQNPSLTYMALTARACHYAVEQLKQGAL